MQSRERFEKTAKAVNRLNDVKALLMTGGDDWKPPTIGRSGNTSDPTANGAIKQVDEMSDVLESLRREESELEDFIGTSLVIIERVKESLGEEYSLMLEARYIDRLPWSEVRRAYGFAKSTGCYLLNIAFDWIDSIGISRLVKGDTEI